MNGKRAKQLRKLSGISIAARRDQREFERKVADTIDARTDSRFNARRSKRYVAAWIALAVTVACVVYVIVGAL